MTPNPTIDQRIAAWLSDEAPTQMPDRVLAATFATTRATRQVGWLSGWRSIRMRSMPVAFAAGAVAILILVVGGVALIGSPSRVASPSPSASAAPTASATASAAPSAAGPFVQPRTGIASQGRITFAFHQDATDKRFLYTIGADGNNLTQIEAAEPCCTVWSPDGTQLAIGEIDPGSGTYRTTLYPATGGSGTVLPRLCGGCDTLTTVDYVPRAWSPDGHWVAIEGSSANSQRTGLYLAVADGKPGASGVNWFATLTGAGIHDVPLAFSRDSRKLLFKRYRSDNGSGDLYVVDTPHDPGPGFSAKPVKLNPAASTIESSDAFGSGVSWSPDGERVAFAGKGSAGTKIYVVDIASGKATAIADASDTTTSARWSPDGQWIAYDIVGPGGPHDEWIVHPDGSGGKVLTTTFSGGVCCGEWSPDSKHLVVQGGSYQDTASPDQLIEVGIDGTWGVLVQLATPTQLEDYSWAP